VSSSLSNGCLEKAQESFSGLNKPTKTRQTRGEELGDFTTSWGVLPISSLVIGIGVLCVFVALILLRLIGLFTNLFYFWHWSTAMVSPVGNHLEMHSGLIPIGGALMIGMLARNGFPLRRGYAVDPLKFL
jgi:hypothetical protein